MPPPQGRNTYLANAVACAPRERLLTMLYDALVNNIAVAEEALEQRDYYTMNERLLRAQEIVLELSGTLKPEVWGGAPALLAIYNYAYRLLVRGNTHRDMSALREAREHLEALQGAWHAAADKVLAERARASA